MTSYDDARPSGCTPFEEELVNAMNDYAGSADASAFDIAPGILRRTRRRRTVGIAAVATALIAAGGGTALATMSDAPQVTNPGGTVDVTLCAK
ncbi:hypothetical protein ACQEWB_30840 [Streptomyces sp. CA-249302]|uniref:hypothetical protein n=1 Tax=Streptomyces sp. CA-249302 TaxID=3240058 RepID=UPI003D8F8A11